MPALKSSQTVERMQRARAQELAFLDIVADITSQLDLDQLLQRVMAEATRILGPSARHCFYMTKGPESFSRVSPSAERLTRSASPITLESLALFLPPEKRSTFLTPTPICASTQLLTSKLVSSRDQSCALRLLTNKEK